MVIPPPLADSEPEPDIRSHTHGHDQTHLNAHNATLPLGAPRQVDHGEQPPAVHHDTSPRARRGTLSTLSDDDAPSDDWVEPSFWQSFKNMVRAVPVLMVTPLLLPIAWGLHFSNQNPVAVFVVSLLAIVPLAGGLGFATEELAIRFSDAWGGLLNATFGNAVELLIAILALVKGDLDIVQASMAGSILSNILLVLGMSYFAGGLRFHEQLYAVVGAQTHISLLGISIAAVLLPEAYHLAWPATAEGVAQANRTDRASVQMSPEELKVILSMSRGLSFILLAVYAMYLTFQLWTHAYLFAVVRENPHEDLPEPNHEKVFPKPHWVPSLRTVMTRDSSDGHMDGRGTPLPPLIRTPTTDADTNPNAHLDLTLRTPSHVDLSGSRSHSVASGDLRQREKHQPEADIGLVSPTSAPAAFDVDVERAQPPRRGRHQVLRATPRVRAAYAFASLAVFTGLAGITAECLVSSIDGLTEHTNVSREFIGLIVLPVVGNAVEHVTAVTVSLKDRLNLSLSIAVGSSVQVSLCLLPLLVLLGWIIGQPMTLLFDTFETICLVVAVVLVNFAISDGRTNYLEGFVLMMAFVSMALVCWYYDPAH